MRLTLSLSELIASAESALGHFRHPHELARKTAFSRLKKLTLIEILAFVTRIVLACLLIVGIAKGLRAEWLSGAMTRTVLSILLLIVLWTIARSYRRLRHHEEDWRFGREIEKMGAATDERYFDSNREALRILKERAEHGKKFALYLRSFDVEMATSASVGQNRSSSIGEFVQIITTDERKAEEALFRSLGKVIPLVASDNPLAWTRFHNPIPRISLPNENWQAAIDTLIMHAEFVVMEISWMSPSIEYELNSLRNSNRQARTVIILQSGEAQERIEDEWYFTQIIGDSGKYTKPLVQIGDPRLAGFARIVRADQINVDLPIPHEAFRGLGAE